MLPCGRVEGVVLYRESQDPDGDDDVHAVVQAGFGLVVVKSREGRRAVRLPGTSSRVDVAGEVLEGRWGLTEIDARRLYGRR